MRRSWYRQLVQTSTLAILSASLVTACDWCDPVVALSVSPVTIPRGEPATVTIRLATTMLPPTPLANAATGTYQWIFSYNDGGECDVAFGEVNARVQ